MENKDNVVAGTVVIDHPTILPAKPPEQALVVEPAVVSDRIIQDVNSTDPALQIKREQWAASLDTLTNSTILGDARAASTLSGMPTQPNFETPNIPQGMVASHTRIRNETLRSYPNMTPEQKVVAAKAALAKYDQEVGMGSDISDPNIQFSRERRRLHQEILEPVVQSVLDNNGQAVDQVVLNNTTLMQELGQNETLRRMVIEEAGQRIDATTPDQMDAALQKQHLLRGVYAQASTVPSMDGGVTPDWAKRASRGQQRRSALAILSTPESAGRALSKAQEWITQAKNANLSESERASAKEKAELGEAVLRIQAEEEKKATKLVESNQPNQAPVIEPGVVGPRPGYADTSRLVEKPISGIDTPVLPENVRDAHDEIVDRSGDIQVIGKKAEQLMDERAIADGSAATERTRKFGKRLAKAAVAASIALLLLTKNDDAQAPGVAYAADTTSPDSQPAVVVADTESKPIIPQSQGFAPIEDNGVPTGPGPFIDSSTPKVSETIGSGVDAPVNLEAAPEVAMSTRVTFGPGETFGEKMFGVDGSMEGGKNEIQTKLNDRANLNFVEATVLANIGENGMPADASEVKKIFDGIRAGTVSQDTGWHMLDDVLVRGTPDQDFTYNMPTKAGVDAVADDRDGVYETKGIERSVTTSEIPDFTVTGADGNPVRVTVGDGSGGPDPRGQQQVVADSSATSGEALVGGDSAKEQELGKPTNNSFGQRLSRFLRRS